MAKTLQQIANDNTAASLATLTANSQNMARDISDIRNDIKDIKGDYVTRGEFDVVKWLVFGFVGLVLTSFIIAIITFIIPHPQTSGGTSLPLPQKSATGGGQ